MAQQINLYNPVFLKQKKHFSAVTMLQAVSLVVGGVLAFYGYTLHESRGLAKNVADSRQQLATQTEQLAAFTREYSPQGRSRQLQDELARANARLKQGEEMLGLLDTGGLGNTAGFARYLTAFARQTVSGVWLTGFSVSGDEQSLNITGRVQQADLVPAYIRALNREDVMRGRRVAELRLTAREEHDTSTAAPGANPAPAAPAAAGIPPKPPARPARYVEFNLIAQRAPEGAEVPAKGKP